MQNALSVRTPDWNGYGVTNDDTAQVRTMEKRGLKKGPVMNALSAAFKFGAPEAYEQGRQRKLKGQLGEALKSEDYGNASNLLIDMGQYDAGMKMRDAQQSRAGEASTQKAQQLMSLTENLMQIPEDRRGQYLMENWQQFEPIVGTDFMTHWQKTGGDVSDASLGEDLAALRTQLGVGAPGKTATFGTAMHEVIGPDGNPMFVRTDNQGGVHPVEGYTPPPDAVTTNQDRVQSTFTDANGNLQMVMRDGSIRSSGMGVQNPFQITDVGGVPTAIDRRTGQGMAVSTPEEVGGNQATIETIADNEQYRRETQRDLPTTIRNAEQSIDTIKQAIEHPGFGSRYGWSSVSGIIPPIPSSDGAAAQGMLDQIGGQAFLEAFESLKGGGHITEIEGDKATAARTRMLYYAQSPEAARQAAQEFIGYIEKGIKSAKAESSSAYAPQGADAPALVYNPETGDFE